MTINITSFTQKGKVFALFFLCSYPNSAILDHKNTTMKKIALSFFAIVHMLTSSAQTPALDWAKGIGGTGQDNGKGMVLDAIGNVYTTGFFTDTVDFDPGVGVYKLGAGPVGATFISKLDVNGNFVWAKSFNEVITTGGGNSYGFAIAIDGSGNIYTTGQFYGTVDFDPGVGVNVLNGIDDIFVSKLDANGNFIWAKNVGGAGSDSGSSIKVDAFGNVCVGGYFTNTVDFDPGASVTNLSSTSRDIFILKLDANGNFIWVKQIGGSSTDDLNALSVDAAGNIFATGTFNSICDFDPSATTFNLSSNGARDVFISKLDNNGSLVWAKSIGGTGQDYGYGITLDVANNVYVVGEYVNTVDFDPNISTTNTVISNGGKDAFILKLNSTGDFVTVTTFGSALGNDNATSIFVDVLNNQFITGSFTNTTDFDTSPSTYTLTSVVATTYILKLDALNNFSWVRKLGGIASSSSKGNSILVDALGFIYTTGFYSNILDVDPNLPEFILPNNGGSDCYIHKMGVCSMPTIAINTTTSFDQCLTNGLTLTASGTGVILWYDMPSSTTSLSAGNTFTTIPPSAGSYTFYAENNTCMANSNRTPITVTVHDLATINIVSSNTLACLGVSATLTATGANTYTWSNSSTASSIVVTPTTTTFYSINGNDIFGCPGYATFTQSVSLCTGINQLVNESSVSVFPNPFTDLITIKNSFENSSIMIVDVLGKVVFEKQIVSNETELDLSHLNVGFYQLFVKGDDKSYTQKIVKQ